MKDARGDRLLILGRFFPLKQPPIATRGWPRNSKTVTGREGGGGVRRVRLERAVHIELAGIGKPAIGDLGSESLNVLLGNNVNSIIGPDRDVPSWFVEWSKDAGGRREQELALLATDETDGRIRAPVPNADRISDALRPEPSVGEDFEMLALTLRASLGSIMPREVGEARIKGGTFAKLDG
jgi:hypothetical protein